MHKWLGLLGLLVAFPGCGSTPPEAELPPTEDTMDMPTDPPPDTSEPADVAARVTVTAVDSRLLDPVDEAFEALGASDEPAEEPDDAPAGEDGAPAAVLD